MKSSTLTDVQSLQQRTSAPVRGGKRDTTQTPPRLMNLREAANYVGVSYWTIRDWVLAGRLPIVRLPPLRPREGERPRTDFRRVVIDRADVDAFIERCKQAG